MCWHSCQTLHVCSVREKILVYVSIQKTWLLKWPFESTEPFAALHNWCIHNHFNVQRITYICHSKRSQIFRYDATLHGISIQGWSPVCHYHMAGLNLEVQSYLEILAGLPWSLTYLKVCLHWDLNGCYGCPRGKLLRTNWILLMCFKFSEFTILYGARAEHPPHSDVYCWTNHPDKEICALLACASRTWVPPWILWAWPGADTSQEVRHRWSANISMW